MTDKALHDPDRHAALQDYLKRLAGAQVWAYQHLDSYSHTLAKIIGFPEDAARLQFERRRLSTPRPSPSSRTPPTSTTPMG